MSSLHSHIQEVSELANRTMLEFSYCIYQEILDALQDEKRDHESIRVIRDYTQHSFITLKQAILEYQKCSREENAQMHELVEILGVGISYLEEGSFSTLPLSQKEQALIGEIQDVASMLQQACRAA